MPISPIPDHIRVKSLTFDNTPESGDGSTITIDADDVIGFAADTLYVNLRDFGAVGDGVTDDTIAVQAAMDSVRTSGNSLYIPSGRYIISSTVDLGRSTGIRYQGTGVTSRNTLTDGAIPQFPSLFIWAGGATPMFTWSGTHCTFSDFAISGGTDSVPVYPSIGFKVTKGSGVGTGKAWFPRFHISHCTVGLQMGNALADDNCDVMTFGKIGFSDCGTGFLVKNQNAQNFTFLDAKFDDVDLCFDFEAGGCLNAHFVQTTNTPKILRVQSGGEGVAWFRLGFVKLDAQQNERVVWIEHTGTGGTDLGHFIVDGGCASTAQNQGGTATEAFQIAGRAVLRVRNVTGGMTNHPNSVVDPSPLLRLNGTDNRTVSAIFDSCGMDDTDTSVDPWVTVTGSGTGRHRSLRDCFGSAGGSAALNGGRIATIDTIS